MSSFFPIYLSRFVGFLRLVNFEVASNPGIRDLCSSVRLLRLKSLFVVSRAGRFCHMLGKPGCQCLSEFFQMGLDTGDHEICLLGAVALVSNVSVMGSELHLLIDSD